MHGAYNMQMLLNAPSLLRSHSPAGLPRFYANEANQRPASGFTVAIAGVLHSMWGVRDEGSMNTNKKASECFYFLGRTEASQFNLTTVLLMQNSLLHVWGWQSSEHGCDCTQYGKHERDSTDGGCFLFLFLSLTERLGPKVLSSRSPLKLNPHKVIQTWIRSSDSLAVKWGRRISHHRFCRPPRSLTRTRWLGVFWTWTFSWSARLEGNVPAALDVPKFQTFHPNYTPTRKLKDYSDFNPACLR